MAEGQGQSQTRKRESEEDSEKKPRLETPKTSKVIPEVKDELYEKFYRRRLNQEGLINHGCPIPDESCEGKIRPAKEIHGNTVGVCKRCTKKFDTTYQSDAKERCTFHSMNSERNRSGRQLPYGCCGKPFGYSGCKTAPQHVHESNRFTDLTGFRKTMPSNKASKESREKDHQIYCLDTESIHSKKGLEVCRVTVLDRNCKEVYETLCLPTTDIIDYNTIWSGLTKADLDPVKKTFREVQDELLAMFSDKTVLVGQCLSLHLLALKLIHPTIVETQDLYPHDRGLPFRRGLKEMARNILGRTIQAEGAHDSKEDAEVTMKLALRAVK